MNKSNVDRFVLFKVQNAHVRGVEEAGIRFKYKGRDLNTGPVVAQLDASTQDNFGVIDLETGKLKIRWTFLISMPLLSDIYSVGDTLPTNNGYLKAGFEESGYLTYEGKSLQVEGPGWVSDDMGLFDGTIISSTNGPGPRDAKSLIDDIVTERLIHLPFNPDYSSLNIQLPQSLGGYEQRLHLTGGFAIKKIMSLGVDPLAERIYQGLETIAI